MPYITREDGERFIIPSYRDVLSAKKPALLKREIMLLSSSYGSYITLHRKNIEQYEVAFSPEAGYLLGETVWHYFKRPIDLIYCEAIPNTTEAILVIVKSGSVYLDGSFPIDSIADELVIFRTQQNYFDIYIYGDVPLSETPEPGKFALDSSSVKSFTVLTDSAFAKLPKIKSFQLQLVDVVLKSHGIGVFPVKQIVATAMLLGLVWIVFEYLSTHRKALPVSILGVVNPYQFYLNSLMTPDAADEIEAVTQKIAALYTVPGWTPDGIQYSGNMLVAKMKSYGVKTSMLYSWAMNNDMRVQIQSDGIYAAAMLHIPNRPPVNSITYLQQVVAELTDRLLMVMPGNHLTLSTPMQKGRVFEIGMKIEFVDQNIDTINSVAEQMRGLPIVIEKISMTADSGQLSGEITLKALGN